MEPRYVESGKAAHDCNNLTALVDKKIASGCCYFYQLRESILAEVRSCNCELSTYMEQLHIGNKSARYIMSS